MLISASAFAEPETEPHQAVDGHMNISIGHDVPFVMTSNPELYGIVRQGIVQRAKSYTTESSKIVLLNLVIDEVLMNVYRHAHRDAPNKRMWITMWDDPEHFYLRVQDEGGSFYDPFDPKEPRNKFRFHEEDLNEQRMEEIEALRRDANHDPTRPDGSGGRGIMLMQQMTQSLVYEPHLIDGVVGGTSVTVGISKRAASEEPCTTSVKKSGWRRLLWPFGK